MRFRPIILTLLLLFTQNVVAEQASKFQIVFDIPSNWQSSYTKYDPDGYFNLYRPLNEDQSVPMIQGILINYGKDIKTPLKESMQQLIDSQKNIGCQKQDYKTLSENNNSLIFTINLSECQNGIDLMQIYKVFNMEDGQYSISYSADPNKIDPKTIEAMKTVIINAKIE